MRKGQTKVKRQKKKKKINQGTFFLDKTARTKWQKTQEQLMGAESQTTRGGWEPRALVGAVPGHRCQREGGEPGKAGVVAGAVLSSHGPAETASVAAANDEYHMLGSWYYKISYVTTAYE